MLLAAHVYYHSQLASSPDKYSDSVLVLVRGIIVLELEELVCLVASIIIIQCVHHS